MKPTLEIVDEYDKSLDALINIGSASIVENAQEKEDVIHHYDYNRLMSVLSHKEKIECLGADSF
jgi:hypothetical protein